MESTSEPTKVDTKIYADYVGRYELELAGSMMTVSQNGDHLMVQLSGQPECQVYPDSETRFSYRVVDAQITFERDTSGKVNRLILHQNGQDLIARKLEPGTEPVAVEIDPKLLDEYVGTYRSFRWARAHGDQGQGPIVGSTYRATKGRGLSESLRRGSSIRW